EHFDSFGEGANPLLPYVAQHGIDMVQQSTVAEQASENHDAFKAATTNAENDTAQRNLLWSPVMEHIRGIADYLKKLYANNPRILGLWGFVVHDSPQKPSLRTSKVKPGEKVMSNAIVIGSAFTNIGITDLHLYRGNSTTGTPNIVHPGEQF